MLELALQLAPQAEFYILHVFEGFEGQLWRGGASQSETTSYIRQWAKGARQELETFLRDVDSLDRSVKQILKYGWASRVIPKTVKRVRADR